MSSGGEDFSLLDVFINVRPDLNIMQESERIIDEYVQRIITNVTAVTQATANTTAQVTAQLNQARQALRGGAGGGGAGGGAGGAASPAGGQDPILRQFELMKREAQDLQKVMAALRTVISSIGDEALQAQLKGLSDLLNRLQTDISRTRQDRNILSEQELQEAYDQQAESLARIAERMRDIEAATIRRAEAEDRLREIQNLENQIRTQENIRDQFAQSRIRGLPSAKDRDEILRIRELIKTAQAEFDQAVREFDGTAEALERVRRAFENLNGPLNATGTDLANNVEGLSGYRRALSDIQGQLQESNVSMNTLANNAYQLGQAFEDAAVGYQLNGIAGAVRGAANNVAFLINDLSRLPQIQALFNERLRTAIPLLAGIGSAAAIIVLPALIEWLESLDDIKGEYIDIASLIEQRFSDLSLQASLNLRGSDSDRFLQDAKDITEIVEKLRDLDVEAKKLQENLRANLQSIGEQNVFQVFTRDIETLRQAFVDLESSFGGLQTANDLISELYSFGLRSNDLSTIGGRIRAFADPNRDFGFDNGFNPNVIVNDIRRIGGSITRAEEDEIFKLTDRGKEVAMRELEKFRDVWVTEMTGLQIDMREISQGFRNGDVSRSTIDDALRSVRLIEDRFKLVQSGTDLEDAQYKRLADSLGAVKARLEEARDLSAEIAQIYENEFSAGIDRITSKNKELSDQFEILRLRATDSATATDEFLFKLSQQRAELAKNLEEVIRTGEERGVSPLSIAQARGAGEQFNRQTIEIQLLTERTRILKEINKLKEEEIERDRTARSVTLERYATEIQLGQLSVNNSEERRRQELRRLQEDALNIVTAQSLFNVGVDFRSLATRDLSALSDADVANKLDKMIQLLEIQLGEQITETKKQTEEVKKIDNRARAR